MLNENQAKQSTAKRRKDDELHIMLQESQFPAVVPTALLVVTFEPSSSSSFSYCRELLLQSWLGWFKETIEKIQQLQVCVENDAHATAIAQQQVESSDFVRQLSELKIAADFTLRSVLEVVQRQNAIFVDGYPARHFRWLR